MQSTQGALDSHPLLFTNSATICYGHIVTGCHRKKKNKDSSMPCTGTLPEIQRKGEKRPEMFQQNHICCRVGLVVEARQRGDLLKWSRQGLENQTSHAVNDSNNFLEKNKATSGPGSPGSSSPSNSCKTYHEQRIAGRTLIKWLTAEVDGLYGQHQGSLGLTDECIQTIQKREWCKDAIDGWFLGSLFGFILRKASPWMQMTPMKPD